MSSASDEYHSIISCFVNYSCHSIIEVPNFEYRKVQLAGVWDHTRSMLLGPKTYENVKGYQVVTPLVRFDGGSTVLVNRGFVSSEALKNLNVLTKETGPVQLVGLLRASQAQNTFTPENRPEKGEWYWADVPAMAEYAGAEARGVQPVYIEAIFGRQQRLQIFSC
jgi:surfeit locus 1 family protein